VVGEAPQELTVTLGALGALAEAVMGDAAVEQARRGRGAVGGEPQQALKSVARLAILLGVKESAGLFKLGGELGVRIGRDDDR
jgi:hypothetical protein